MLSLELHEKIAVNTAVDRLVAQLDPQEPRKYCDMARWRWNLLDVWEAQRII